jgi:GxxExxY protein
MVLSIQSQVPIPVIYKSVRFEFGFRLDILVENQVVVEIKSVKTLHDVHKKQLLTYLKLTGKKLGILVNFNSSHLVDKGIFNKNCKQLLKNADLAISAFFCERKILL